MEDNSVKIKICGLSRPEDIEYVNEARPDYCGFIIHVPKSIRNTTPAQVRALREKLSPDIIPVGVFRNEPVESVAALLLDGTISVAQLHGSEDEAYIAELRSYGDFPIIQAFHEQSLNQAAASSADMILLDHAGGGTGETFAWALADQIRRPYFLAGGLGPDNILEALERLHPWGVDMSSMVETDGKKDRNKIQKVTELIREWEAAVKREAFF